MYLDFHLLSYNVCIYTGYPITTEMVRYGLRVGVLALPVNPRMLTPRAMRVVGPAAFGLHYVTYHPPRPLPRTI